MPRLMFLVKKDGSVYDMTSLVSKATLSGRRGAAARSLSVTLMDDDGKLHERSGIDCGAGQICAFYWDGIERFTGIIMNTSIQKKRMAVKAYDSGIYLSNNKDSYTYTNATASQIFVDCITRLGIPMGEVADTKYVIPELPKPKTTPFDVICDALSQTYKATGERFFPISMNGKYHLWQRRMETVQWVLEVGGNLSSYNYSKSIEKVRDRIRLLTKDGEVIAEKVNEEAEQRYGMFRDIDTPDDELNEAQLDELATSMLAEKSNPVQELSLDTIGIAEVYAGKCVYVLIPELGLGRTFFVDSDTHTFEGEKHTMKLKLNFHANIAAIE